MDGFDTNLSYHFFKNMFLPKNWDKLGYQTCHMILYLLIRINMLTFCFENRMSKRKWNFYIFLFDYF